jgi:hypothetical protein
MSAQPEVWRVSTVEGIFETDLETLKQWISEGCVLPTDKVSKGTLNWIDAGLAPMLRAAFAGDFTPQPPPQPVYPEAAGGWQVPQRFDGMSSSHPSRLLKLRPRLSTQPTLHRRLTTLRLTLRLQLAMASLHLQTDVRTILSRSRTLFVVCVMRRGAHPVRDS